MNRSYLNQGLKEARKQAVGDSWGKCPGQVLRPQWRPGVLDNSRRLPWLEPRRGNEGGEGRAVLVEDRGVTFVLARVGAAEVERKGCLSTSLS